MSKLEGRTGILLSIEGMSGSGKTSTSIALKKMLEKNKHTVLLLGGFEIHTYSSPITRFCRELVQKNRFVGLPWNSEIYLLIAELLFDIEQLVKPALIQGQIVIFDGYWDSLIAYESARIKLLEPERSKVAIEYINSIINTIFTFQTIPQPDYTVYLDCDLMDTKIRLENRDNLPVSAKDLELQMEIDRQYSLVFEGRTIIRIKNDNSSDQQSNVKKILDNIQFSL